VLLIEPHCFVVLGDKRYNFVGVDASVVLVEFTRFGSLELIEARELGFYRLFGELVGGDSFDDGRGRTRVVLLNMSLLDVR
jgi:hypothetical protein